MSAPLATQSTQEQKFSHRVPQHLGRLSLYTPVGKVGPIRGKKKKKKVDLELILCKKLMTNIVSKNIPHKKQPGLCEETADSKAGAYKLTDEHRPSCYA